MFIRIYIDNVNVIYRGINRWILLHPRHFDYDYGLIYDTSENKEVTLTLTLTLTLHCKIRVWSTGSRKNRAISIFCDNSSNKKSNKILTCKQLELIRMCLHNFLKSISSRCRIRTYILTRRASLTSWNSY